MAQTKSASAPHDHALSETILSSGETRSADSNQGEQGMFFQHGDPGPSHEGMQVPFETAQHGSTVFHVMRLTDHPPSAASGAEQSGPVLIGAPDDGSFGTVLSGSLELSTVDLATEFVKMVTTQRAFQASSRTITVTDTLLEEVSNLKP